MAARGARRALAVRPLRLRRTAHAGHRTRGTVRQGDRRDDGHRPEGDVQLHGQGRRSHHAASGGDAEHGAGVRRAQPRARPAGGQAVFDGPDVPLRAAAEGALPAVPSARRGSVRPARSGGGRGSHRPGVEPRRVARHCRRPSSSINSVGVRGLPAALPGGAARKRSARICGSSARTASAARRRIRCASTTARCRPTSRSSIGCRTRWTTCASRAPRISRRCAATSTPGRFRGASRTGWSAGSITTRARRSRSSARRSARRTRCSAAAGTTGW